MTDVYSGHSQFVLLTDNRRRWFDGRTLFLITVITVPIFIFCGIYMIILKSNESLLYPKSYVEVSWISTHRANIYSTHWKNQKTDDIYLTNTKNAEIDEFKVVCYYCFPGNDTNALQPQKIDPFLCTHIIVGFGYLINNTLALTQQQMQIVQTVLSLKQINEKLKVLVSISGGSNDVSLNTMVLNHTNRKTFIRSVVHLVKNYGIDGVDLDWEFPNEDQGQYKNQKIHFTQLLEEFRATINKQIRHKFLLTLAVAAPVVIIDNAYDVKYMNEFVDFINVMMYDFHFYTKATPFTGFNSPLFASYDDKGYFKTLNINYSAHYWLSKGMSREKIIIGLPTYGHTFRLTNLHNKGLYAPARGYGRLGSNGFVDYTQVCKFLNLNQISPIFDVDSKSPYVTKGSEWVSFDNEQSLSFKAEFVRDYQFGGAMIWSLNSDDYMGACKVDPNVQNQPFPLVRKIREILSRNYSIF